MERLTLIVAIAVGALAGCATAQPSGYIYFPQLAQGVLAGDPSAFRQLLAQAMVTPPGEQLEELVELSSRFVRLEPTEFLRGQA
ncbi:MAG: hypothetical protein LC667_19445, partial [Thioalkalivibrio sp.]|nr:hypothetical protein [Thioalkalivibrio sp.]